MNTTLNTRRKALIQALRSGKFRKGIHALFSQKVDYDPWDVPSVKADTQSFCCLGVGRYLIPLEEVPANWIEEVTNSEDEEVDDAADYASVCWYYGIDEMLKQYLMGMNDGGVVHRPRDGIADGDDITIFNGRKIRMGEHPRSHAFIARYLELVWKL